MYEQNSRLNKNGCVILRNKFLGIHNFKVGGHVYNVTKKVNYH